MLGTKHRIGGFRIIAPIGAGGFSTVYRALEEDSGREVAIKVLAENHSLVPDTRRRFEEEMGLLMTVRSPSVARIHKVGETESGQPFMVLELADRGDLRRRLEEIRSSHQVLDHDDLRKLALHLYEGLHTLHDMDIVHRDVSPSNILIRSDGGGRSVGPVTLLEETERFLLTDLGHAKDMIIASGFTAGGGTRGFASPEQREDVAVVDHRADIFAATAIIEWAAVDGPYTNRLERFYDSGLASDPDDRCDSMEAWHECFLDMLEHGEDDSYRHRIGRYVRKFAAGVSPEFDDLDPSVIPLLNATTQALGEPRPTNGEDEHEEETGDEITEFSDDQTDDDAVETADVETSDEAVELFNESFSLGLLDRGPETQPDGLPAFDEESIERLLAGAARAAFNQQIEHFYDGLGVPLSAKGPSRSLRGPGPPSVTTSTTRFVLPPDAPGARSIGRDGAAPPRAADLATRPDAFVIPTSPRNMVLAAVLTSVILMIGITLIQQGDSQAELGSAPLPDDPSSLVDSATEDGPASLVVTGSSVPDTTGGESEVAGAVSEVPLVAINAPVQAQTITGDLMIEGQASSSFGLDEVFVSIRSLETLEYWDPEADVFRPEPRMLRLNAQGTTDAVTFSENVPAGQLTPGDYEVRAWISGAQNTAANRFDAVTVTVVG